MVSKSILPVELCKLLMLVDDVSAVSVKLLYSFEASFADEFRAS